MISLNTKKTYFFIFSILLTLFFYTYDLSNLDGLRQGTEGFYLQVSKEMEQKSSLLTPYYRGERHWSKPPLHFIFPLVFSKTGQFTHIHSARLSIALLTIILLLITSHWVKRHFEVSMHTSFLFLACTVGMFKYARIFMMEIPLSLLTFVSILFSYDYYKFKKSIYLALAVLFASCAILIKGPVSIIITIFALGLFILYLIFTEKSLPIKSTFKFVFWSLFFGSIWFVLSYIRYGHEFFDYFFLREIVGKFTAKSYPIRHVIQGLIIFTLPWSLFLPYSYLSIKDYLTKKNYHSNKKLVVFLIINALSFLVIWCIPSQRSHHYAMPAVPFFLVLILITLVKSFSGNREHDKRFGIFKVGNILLFSGAMLVTVVLSVACYYIDVILPHKDFFYEMLLLVTLVLLSAITFLRSRNITFKSLSAQIFIGIVWVILAPNFIPAFIPNTAKNIMMDKNVIASVRKPYFVEEAIGQSITLQHASEMKKTFENDAIYLLRYEDFINNNFQNDAKILHEWDIWRRRTTAKQIFNALKIRDISSLRQKYVLFQKK